MDDGTFPSDRPNTEFTAKSGGAIPSIIPIDSGFKTSHKCKILSFTIEEKFGSFVYPP